MKKIAIVGSTELAGQLIYYFESTGFAEVVGLLDDYESPGTMKHDRPILGKISDAPSLFKEGAFETVAIGIGYKHRKFRQQVYENLKRDQVSVATFVHPSAYVEESARIGDGCIVLVGCTILMNAELQPNVFLAPKAFVSHDVKVRAHAYCTPAVNLAGKTDVGERCFIGIGTTTINGVSIGADSVIAAGSVVTKDVPPSVLAAGVPAKIKKELSSE